MSELVDKQVTVQKENLKKTSGVHAKLPKAHEKVCDEKETNIEKTTGAFDGRKKFIRRVCVRKTHIMDIQRLQVNDSSYIEGTICLVYT